MDRNVFNKPLRACSWKKGKDKMCPFADQKDGFESCMLFEFMPMGQCTNTMRLNVQKDKFEQDGIVKK